MKKMIVVLLTCVLPAIALPGCGGSGAQEADGHDAGDSTHASEEHDHGSSDGTSHDDGDHDANDGVHTMDMHSHASRSGAGHEHAPLAGTPGIRADITRTVELAMDDSMRFTPDRLTFDAGETVRFVVRNNGKIPHEFVIGSMDELMEHAAMMRAMPTMQHAEANMLTLTSGAAGEVIWHFEEPGNVDFACLIPGHLEAGMRGLIEIE